MSNTPSIEEFAYILSVASDDKVASMLATAETLDDECFEGLRPADFQERKAIIQEELVSRFPTPPKDA